jgi:glycine/D-amino acid oxidase-like deaminating enzyme
MTADSFFEVIIVGAGVAGASAAYHLQQAGVNNILILDAGPEPGEGLAPRCSGSATMPENTAPCVKMMVQLFAGSCHDFMHHHGEKGAQRYLQAARTGLDLQKQIAQIIWNEDEKNSNQHIRQLGSYYVAYRDDEEVLRKEYEILQELGCDDIEWCDRERLASVPGASNKFFCGIFFPQDAVIDSSMYAKTLVQHVLSKASNSDEKSSVQFSPHTKVRQVTQNDDEQCVLVSVDSASTPLLRSNKVVMATGGLFPIPQLNGLLKPCYSYLVHVPISSSNIECKYSANFFTWGYTHDWCFTNGRVRISGEDHFSAHKTPHSEERNANLAKWTLGQYDCSPDANIIDSYCKSLPQQYGIYSETPDMAPLIGTLKSESRICYLVGCNAWGQTILSYGSSLVPGLLHYKELTGSQKDALQLLSIRRFSHLPTK